MTHLVDVGTIIPVNAVTALDALHLALLRLGCEGHVDRENAVVYELGLNGAGVRKVYDVRDYVLKYELQEEAAA